MYLTEFLSPVGDAFTPKVKEKIDELPETENDFIDDINSQNFVGSNQANFYGLGTGIRNDVSKKSNEKAVTRNTR